MGRREAHNLVPLGFAFRELRFFGGALRCAFADTELAASARARMAQNMSMLRSAAVSERDVANEVQQTNSPKQARVTPSCCRWCGPK